MGQHLLYRFDLQAHNLLDFVAVEGVNIMISSIRLRNSGRMVCLSISSTGSLGLFHSLVARLGSHLGEVLADYRRTHVGGHDYDGVLEVDVATLVVGETSVVEYLETGC